MIIGECPYCDGTMMTSIMKIPPGFTRELCGDCGKYSWLYHSRLAPIRYSLREFKKRFIIEGNQVKDREKLK